MHGARHHRSRRHRVYHWLANRHRRAVFGEPARARNPGRSVAKLHATGESIHRTRGAEPAVRRQPMVRRHRRRPRLRAQVGARDRQRLRREIHRTLSQHRLDCGSRTEISTHAAARARRRRRPAFRRCHPLDAAHAGRNLRARDAGPLRPMKGAGSFVLIVCITLAAGACTAAMASSTPYEQSYLHGSYNWALRRRFSRADRLLNAFDYGHAILYQTLITRDEAAARIDGPEFELITKRILPNPPNLPLDESAI